MYRKSAVYKGLVIPKVSGILLGSGKSFFVDKEEAMFPEDAVL